MDRSNHISHNLHGFLGDLALLKCVIGRRALTRCHSILTSQETPGACGKLGGGINIDHLHKIYVDVKF